MAKTLFDGFITIGAGQAFHSDGDQKQKIMNVADFGSIIKQLNQRSKELIHSKG